MGKKEIRQAKIKARLTLDKEVYQVKSLKIIEMLLKASFFNIHQPLAIYMSMNQEVNTLPLIEYCLKEKIPFALPKVEGDEMNFYYVNDLSQLKVSRFGVLEPAEGILADNLKTLIVPLVAFNNTKERIGYGKGYYDRYIAKYHPKTIGVAFSLQEDTFIGEVHDQPLDYIITEDKIYM